MHPHQLNRTIVVSRYMCNSWLTLQYKTREKGGFHLAADLFLLGDNKSLKSFVLLEKSTTFIHTLTQLFS